MPEVAPDVRRLAIVFCVHHKPWLIQATLLSLAMQDACDADLIFLVNEGDGRRVRRARFAGLYEEYDALAAAAGANPHLDAFDPAVEEACAIHGARVRVIRLENDHALDSGAWLKFIQGGSWRAYSHVWFVGEGCIFTRSSSVSDAMAFMQARGAHFLTAGHLKRRLPKPAFVERYCDGDETSPAGRLQAFHQRMIRRTFDLFRADPAFDAVYDAWPSDCPVESQVHVPDVSGPGSWWLQMYARLYPSAKALAAGAAISWRQRAFMRLAPLLTKLDRRTPRSRPVREGDAIRVNQRPRRRQEVVDAERYGRTYVHGERGPEWYGCSCTHLVSHEFLERLDARLVRSGLYDIIDLPFAASALEITWALMPGWLGVDKYFHDGIHRVIKHPISLRREDDAEGMCRYVNRYYAGRLSIEPTDGPFLRIRKAPKTLGLGLASHPRYASNGPRDEKVSWAATS